MSDVANGNGLTSPSFQFLDNKIDASDQKFSRAITELRTEAKDSENRILDRIDKHQSKPSSQNWLIAMGGIALATLTSVFGYITNDLDGKIVNSSVALDKQIAIVSTTLAQEIRDRDLDRKQVYQFISDKVWHKDAQEEFAKRMDERSVYQQVAAERERIDAKEQLTHLAAVIDNMDTRMVPLALHEQKWKDEAETRTLMERNVADSLNRITEHLNRSDEAASQYRSDVDKSLHGYGLPDEVKDLQTQLRSIDDKLFHLISPSEGGGALPKTPAD